MNDTNNFIKEMDEFRKDFNLIKETNEENQEAFKVLLNDEKSLEAFNKKDLVEHIVKHQDVIKFLISRAIQSLDTHRDILKWAERN